MKKLLFILLVPLLLLFAASSDHEVNARIWHRIIFDLSLPEYRIYTPDKQLRKVLEKIPNIHLEDRCEYATLIIETRNAPVPVTKCPSIPRLSNDYRLFLRHKNDIGAFFWMKGRPTIIFSRPRIEAFGLKIDKEMNDYMENIP
ncbi:hypothetical protein [Hydrogenimonas cancrithermarum]|uniref:Uncharacterized protein n=1 Tax=Hydrogenimonas cancrithermarum TaxID=2993563 RepID=A0ABN6WT09_9BACT|nr:hypothetical protein [Hydrogenimonas cancrithermarum]BDY11790.1 hypothetical protein HCR_01020 [Hydrogenimonas cancrithermarum]